MFFRYLAKLARHNSLPYSVSLASTFHVRFYFFFFDHQTNKQNKTKKKWKKTNKNKTKLDEGEGKHPLYKYEIYNLLYIKKYKMQIC